MENEKEIKERIDNMIVNLQEYFGVATQAELAARLNTSQSAISSWRRRGSFGAVVTMVMQRQPDALPYLFPLPKKVEEEDEKDTAITIFKEVLKKMRERGEEQELLATLIRLL